MSCGCENQKKASEYDRMARLAKTCAKMEGVIMELRQRPDGTYSFNRLGVGGDGKLIEYIHYL